MVVCHIRIKEFNRICYLAIPAGSIIWCIPFFKYIRAMWNAHSHIQNLNFFAVSIFYYYIYIYIYIVFIIYIYIYIYHQVVPPARISLAPSSHFSLLFIAFDRSSGFHHLSSHSYCMYVRAGRPSFAWPYAGFHRSKSLMSSSLLPQQCPVCLVRLTCIVFVIGGKWPYCWCLGGCWRQDLFNIGLNILV